MKTKLITLSFLFFSLCVFGQISVGIKAGLPFLNGNRMFGNYGSNTFTTTEKDYNGYFGLVNVGLLSNYKLNKKYAIQLELLYKEQGISQNEGRFEKMNLSYFEIPILFQRKGTHSTFWFVNAGPSVKIKTDARYSYRPDISKTTDIEINANDAFESMVFVANLGGGVSVKLKGKFSLVGELRFSYDMTQTAKQTDSVKFETGDEWFFNNSHILHISALVGLHYKL